MYLFEVEVAALVPIECIKEAATHRLYLCIIFVVRAGLSAT
jgi:hypothetical protein